MEFVARQTHVRGSQQRLRDVARLVKKLSVPQMKRQLTMMNKDAARRILETLKQAIANATHNHGVSEDQLILKEMLILRGPHYKRMRAVSRGMGHAILKRTSHIVIKLEKKQIEEVVAKPVVDEVQKEEVVAKPVVKKVTKSIVQKVKKEKKQKQVTQ